MSYDANCAFEHDIIRIHRDDVIWFDSDTNSAVAAIYQTDEHGQLLEPDRAIFQPQHNSMNYFMKPFREEGVFYFVVDFNPNDSKKKRGSSAVPLAVIVIPDITFHVRIIDKDRFDSDTVISHVNDFVVWHFSEKISENLIQLSSEEKLSDVLSCHQRAVMGRPRHCLAVECTVSGMFFFANPGKERKLCVDLQRVSSIF